MVPRRLSKYGKGKRMHLNDPIVGVSRSVDAGENLRTVKIYGRHSWLERPDATEHLASIISRHPDRRNFGGQLVCVKVGGVSYVGSSVGKVYSALRIVRKAREEFVSYRNHLVWL